ncbi:hypothetical protein [Granulicella sp. dw_53]|uniref:hypothetical protein n=1 Tax=Granulicella sp. dw_53 TaxID=2719792 RepID=UPI001BD52911|nr:hypothetical protein [Granulicella sp. dw_53]
MSKCTLRYIFTILMYAGIFVFLIPYISGKTSAAMIFLIAGVGIAVGCGLMRCYFSESDPTEQHLSSKPLP